MLYLPTVISIIEVLIVTLPVLFVVAFVTVAERKTMASMQRRLGPNIVGYYGLLQAFADALKLLLKEYVSPTQANLILFFLGPIITLVFSLLGYAVIPFAPGLAISDFDLGILYMLAVSSLATYGILLAGWSANSKYAFLGSLRSTAQLISYELILSSAILLVVLLTSSLNLTINIEAQKAVWFIVPLFPIFLIFFIGSVAETNRAPFDLAEAESELVSGFMTEHAAVIFVFFFLAEYGSIVLMCILISVLFLGGYNLDFSILSSLIVFIYNIYDLFLDYFEPVFLNTKHTSIDAYNYLLNMYELPEYLNITNIEVNKSEIINMDAFKQYQSDLLRYNVDTYIENLLTNPRIENIVYALIIGTKTVIMIFVFIWVRASFPRIRFDQLMSYCWTVLLPIVFAFILLIPCILYIFEIIPSNVLFS